MYSMLREEEGSAYVVAIYRSREYMTDIFNLATNNGELSRARRQIASEGERHVHIAIVGTGFSGLGAAIRLKQQGLEQRT